MATEVATTVYSGTGMNKVPIDNFTVNRYIHKIYIILNFLTFSN